MSNEEFIDMIGQAAVKWYKAYKILPSLTIAQAILESNWGKSTLAQKAHNYFGMKAGEDYKRPVIELDTKEQTSAGKTYTVKGRFRKYRSVSDGIAGYYRFLQYPRYKNLKGVTDYKEACFLIRADGWATDVKYTEKLLKLIKKYNLTRYDEEVFEMVEKASIVVDGKETFIRRILKDGSNYINVRELAELIGYDISNRGNTPILTKKE